MGFLDGRAKFIPAPTQFKAPPILRWLLRGRRPELASLRGNTRAGVTELRVTLARHYAARTEILSTKFMAEMHTFLPLTISTFGGPLMIIVSGGTFVGIALTSRRLKQPVMQLSSALWAIVIAIWALQLVWSVLWLSRFDMGPFEWAWRCLAFGRRIPILRPPSSVTRSAASV